MARRFVSDTLQTGASGGAVNGEPVLPASFTWHGAALEVGELVRCWRSTKNDRGDDYLDKHWFEFVAADGRRAVVYVHRRAKRGQPRWWLYTIDDAE